MTPERLAAIERYVRSQYPRTAAHTPNGLSDTEIIAELLAEVQRLRRMPLPGREYRKPDDARYVTYIDYDDGEVIVNWTKGKGGPIEYGTTLPDWLAWSEHAEVVDG